MKYFSSLIALLFIALSIPSNAQEYWISGSRNVKTCKGTFHDNGGPNGKYNRNDYTQTYTSADNKRLQFKFTYWEVFHGASLSIYDGPTTSHPLIGEYGYKSGSPGTIVSTDSSLTFEWDGLNSGGGWDATISCLAPIPKLIMSTSSVDSVCSGSFYDSGSGGAAYGNGERLTQTILPNDSTKFLRIDFPSDFSIGKGDSLFVYDGNDTLASLLAVYTQNNQFEQINAQQAGAGLTFQFTSDASVTSSGWQAAISCQAKASPTKHVMGGGIRYNACGNEFYDNGGPSDDYKDQSNGEMRFVSTTDCGLGLDITSWEVFSGDWLTIYDGMSTSSSELGKFSYLSSGAPGKVNATNNSLTLTFRSVSNADGFGWAGTITCPQPTPPKIVVKDDIDTACSGDSVVLVLPDSATYLWNTSETTRSLNAKKSGSYFAKVLYSTGCQLSTDTVNVHFHTLPATPTITVNDPLQFCQGDSVSLTSSIASEYLWSTGSTTKTITLKSSARVSVAITDSNGCSSVSSELAVVAIPIPAKPVITADGFTLRSSSKSGNQWYLNGTPISGAIDSTYIPKESGSYTVQVTENGCTSDASEPHLHTHVSDGFGLANQAPTVYPNPSSGVFFIHSDENVRAVQVYDLSGKILLEKYNPNDALNLKGLNSGSYLLVIRTSEKTHQRMVSIM